MAGNMGKMAQGVADKLECSVIAPPVPIMLGAFAVCTGVAFVRHIRNRRGRNDQTSSPPSSEVCAACKHLLFEN